MIFINLFKTRMTDARANMGWVRVGYSSRGAGSGGLIPILAHPIYIPKYVINIQFSN